MALTNHIGSNEAGKFGAIRTYTVGASSGTIWRGATVVLRLTDGFVYPGVEDLTDAYKQLVVGWALEKGTPDNKIRVRADGQYFRNFPYVTQADVGRLALLKDDETVHTYSSGAGKVVVGRIASIKTDSLEVFVDFTDRPMRVVPTDADSLYL